MRVDGIPGHKSVIHEDLPKLIPYMFPRMPRLLAPFTACPCSACCHVHPFFLSSPPDFSVHMGTICRVPMTSPGKSCQTCPLENKPWRLLGVGSTQIAVEPHSTMIAHVDQGLCDLVCTSWEQPDKMSEQLKRRVATRLSK